MEYKINGNTDGIKSVLLERMKLLYDMSIPAGEFVSKELLGAVAEFSGSVGREVSVYIGRDGSILDVSVGEAGKVRMPSMRLVRNEDRLCGVRCVHTHPNGDGRLSGVDLGTLMSARLDAMCALAVNDSKPGDFYAAFPGGPKAEREALIFGPFSADKLPDGMLLEQIKLADERLKSPVKEVCDEEPERAILVGIENDEPYDTLEELFKLADTAGVRTVARFLQRRRVPDNATYIGSGKAEELSLAASELEADLFIFDDELSAVQTRNLEQLLNVRVIDRTTLILDIFSARAASREGKLQVELAQQKYRLPRLTGMGASMAKMRAGVGMRGPGEKKLETDRRRIRRRIFELQSELEQIDKQRRLRRVRREKNSVPLVALVGYTNAGKSTLLNALSGSDVLAEDKLFATLDPVMRQVTLPGKTQAVFSDTVGFINKLPHDLINAFRSTLEEVSNADLILHVADISSGYCDKQMRVVEDVLYSLNAGCIPRINVYNKADAYDKELPLPQDGILISALNGTGLIELLERTEKILNKGQARVELTVPYDKYEALAVIRSAGSLISEEHGENSIHIVALLDEAGQMKVKRILDGGA
ncbi:MAG: GTPase HflX [Firmicutes bacterium ADurb.Bin182]|nr:MAG: GTPase HflX [Firmicutes bacterium ADurb.Bin182]